MTSRKKQSLMKRANMVEVLVLLFRTIGQHASIMLLFLLSMGVGLGAPTASAQTRAYLTNVLSSNVSVIDISTNTVVATIPVG